MDRIARWTAKQPDSQDWLLDQLNIDLNAKLDRINPDHELWDLLDKSSQATQRNFLMWRGHIKHNETITITHFGPMGYRQEFVFTNALSTSPRAGGNSLEWDRVS